MADAASALGVFSVLTDDYGLAMVQAITSRLNKNKTTLLCGLPVGYDIDSVYDCLGLFVINKNTLIGAADEPDLEQYLLTIIPENVPGKRKGKKAIVKVLVQSWGGIRQLEFSHLSSSTQPAQPAAMTPFISSTVSSITDATPNYVKVVRDMAIDKMMESTDAETELKLNKVVDELSGEGKNTSLVNIIKRGDETHKDPEKVLTACMNRIN